VTGTAIAFDQRADEAASMVLEDLLATIEANYEDALDGRDPEALHDLRVSIRRSRAVQRELKGVFPRNPLAHFRAEFRWLQQATGPARDMDVYVHGFDSLRSLLPTRARADVEPLLSALAERRRRARLEMERALRSQRATGLLGEWRSLIEGLRELPEDARPDGACRIGELAGARIARLYKRMLHMGCAITPSSPPEAYHDLRKLGKELRYMLELFGASLYAAEVTASMIKTLKALQDVLGRHQDREVQAALLRSLEGELAPAAREAVGLLVARLEQDQAESREQFAVRFARFASAEQRELVESTFA
jgi:CHAD domain-containing protein